jgi:hypothetical protein
MNWWHVLLGLDAPEHTALKAAAVSFRGLIPWWLGVLMLAAIGAGVFLLYSRERARIGVPRRALLAFLRLTAIGLVVVLLLRPILVAAFSGERPRAIVFLVDNSQSMTQQDRRLTSQDRVRVAIAEGSAAPDTAVPDEVETLPQENGRNPTRAQLVRLVLENPRLGLVQRLEQRAPLQAFLFGQRLRSRSEQASAEPTANPAERLLGAYQTDETRTALADAINDLLVRSAGDLPTAIVLVTDGQDNASKLALEDAARECARLQVPLHIYGVGSSRGGMFQLKDVSVPETIFAEDTVAVPLRWRSRGFKQGTVVITLTLGEKVVSRREVPVRDGDDLREVMTFTPDKGIADKLDFVASIKLKGNDAFADSVKRNVRVIDQKVRILYVENSPRWEYKFLQPALLRDRRAEARFLLINGDPQALQTGPPYLDKFPESFPEFDTGKQKQPFDLLVLGDVPAAFLGAERLRRIRDFVKEGGGLIMIAGREHAPAEYAESPLAEVLPVEFQPAKFATEAADRSQPFSPVLTLAGKHNDMLALADSPDENQRVWDKLPGFHWYYPVTRLRPGATTLLAHPKQQAGQRPMPVMATHYYGKGQVLFVGTDETWRWRYNAQDRYLARFWGQVIYQMSLPHLLGSSNRTQLALDRSDAILGRPGYIYARLLDARFQPLRAPSVAGRLEFLDAADDDRRFQTIELKASAQQPGEYRAPLPNDVPGRFELKIAQSDELESGSLQYRVDLPPRHELEAAGMAEQELREAARISGGRFYREEDLHRLPEEIEPRQTVFVQRQEVLLWNPLVFLMFVGLVTTEWVVRRFSHLS